MQQVILAVFVAVVCLATCPAQRTWTVDRAGRPGTDFTDLPPAVLAAAVGDTIVIVGQPCEPFPGEYTAPTISKGLRLVGTGGGINLNGNLVVAGVPRSEAVVLQHVNLAAAVSGTFPVGIAIRNCAGPVHLEDCRVQSALPSSCTATFVDCADLSITRSHFRLDHAAVMERSTIRLTGCKFECGGKNFNAPNQRCTSIVASNSRLTLLDTHVQGSAGRFGDWINCGGFWPHAPGLRAFDCSIVLGPGSRVDGGYATGCYVCCNYSSSGCFEGSIRATQSTVYQDPNAMIECPLPVVLTRVHAVTASPAWQGLGAGAVVATAPRSLVLLGAGFEREPVATSVGPLLLEPATLTVVGMAAADHQGRATFRVTSDLPPGTLFSLQGAVLLPDCAMTMTGATRVSTDTVPVQ